VSAAFDATPRLEKYELLEELGHGGMATVYRARDRRLGREVAVKIIHRHLRDEREVKERFAREAKAVAKLRHPAIVEVYDVSEPDEPERYIVMELVTGITLRTLIKEHAPLPPELVLGVGVCLAEALYHAHEQGVVHRDVKPENVLLAIPSRLRGEQLSDRPSRSGNVKPSHPSSSMTPLPRHGVEVKLTDFGIAKVLDIQGVTSTGEVLGSPAHMAPEQIEGQAVGPKADIFSLGVLLYEALVGTLPFQGNNPAQTLRRVLDGQFVSTERIRPEVGRLIGRLIDRALAHAPEQRFEDAAEFATAMRCELTRANVTEPLSELALFLEAPEAYADNYNERFLPSVLEAAKAARRNGQVPLATALYNRALTLRPGDPAIIADVARLTRLRRFRQRILPLGLLTLAVSAICVTGVHFYGTLMKARSAKSKPVQPKVAESRAVVVTDPGEPQKAVARSLAVKNDGTGEAFAAEPKRGNGQSRGNGKSTARPVTPTGTRTVQVELRGAKGSRLLIDGVERPWFGAKHELEYGVHRFHVIAPTENCCIVPEPKVVKVSPGEGELDIVMVVEFRDAQLQFGAVDGSTLTCGELFPGVLESPGRRSVRLTQAETRASCTLIPPVDSGKHPRTIDVVLRPGGTFTVNGS
jgi:serine/threonine-protein kinase